MISKYSGILSAYGLSLADVVHEEQEPSNLQLNETNMKTFVLNRIESLRNKCVNYLIHKENFTAENVKTNVFLNLRYDGTDSGIMCQAIVGSDQNNLQLSDFSQSFVHRYQQEYGFVLDRSINIDDIRIRGIGKYKIDHHAIIKQKRADSKKLEPLQVNSVYFNGQYLKTNIYDVKEMLFNDVIIGPAVIIDKNSTILVEPKCTATLTETGDVEIDVEAFELTETEEDLTLDTTQLSVFSHRFMSIAEQMGR